MLATEIPIKANRISALDFTKGALVLFMVLYHWINYFIGMEWPYYRYLRFLSPSFIFISGFMVSSVYLTRYQAVDLKLSKRLMTRGLKLLLIFLVLNFGRVLVLPILSPGTSFVLQADEESLIAAFITGNFSTKIVSFSILVPIGYLLIMSGLLMPLYRHSRWVFQIVFALFFLGALWLELIGSPSMNLEILSIGMLGVVIGIIPMDKINRIVQYPYLVAIAYLLYTIAISIYNVPFLLQISGTCLTLMVIYVFAHLIPEDSRIRATVDKLGRYSLFGYIVQIVILQLLAATLRHAEPNLYKLVGSFFAAFLLTIFSVEMLDRTRRAAAVIDKVYKTVFN